MTALGSYNKFKNNFYRLGNNNKCCNSVGLCSCIRVISDTWRLPIAALVTWHLEDVRRFSVCENPRNPQIIEDWKMSTCTCSFLFQIHSKRKGRLPSETKRRTKGQEESQIHPDHHPIPQQASLFTHQAHSRDRNQSKISFYSHTRRCSSTTVMESLYSPSTHGCQQLEIMWLAIVNYICNGSKRTSYFVTL